MSPTTIAYSELYVASEGAAISYLTERWNFHPFAVAGPATGVFDRRSTALRNGAVTLVVTSPLGPDSAVARFVDEHGDSIADLAFLCDDVRTDLARATDAGAIALRPLSPSLAPGQDSPHAVVSGFGDVCHTLLGPATGQVGALPPDRRWDVPRRLPEPVDGPRAPKALDLKALDHVAVCVEAGTLQDTVDYYDRAFGLPCYSEEYIEVGDQAMDSTVVRGGSGGVTFTLIEPDPSRHPGQIDQFLSAHSGAGVQHLAFLVDDIVSAVRELGDHGVDFLQTPGTYYDALEERVGQLAAGIGDLRDTNVLIDRDEWGYLLQIFTRSPYPRDTLFYELIQRNGARGFGSSNIKALYEAVERSREAAAR